MRNNKNDTQAYMVSVVCDVFNHEPYLRECLEGLVNQVVDFPYEILIHDDASTDKSAEIIKKYVEAYPSIDWKPIYQKENQFSKGVSIWNDIQFPRAKGKYIALCEGDDYWIDSHKLQKQVDILEADSSLIAVVTNSQTVDADGNLISQQLDRIVPNNKEGRYNLREFFKFNNTYPTATIVYRNTNREKRELMFRKTLNAYLGDWTLWIILHTFGDFYYMNEVTSAYRINPTSITHTKVDERRLGLAEANFTIIKNVRDILPDEYADIKKELKNTAWMWFNLANAYKHLHQYVKMACCLLICGIKNPKLLYKKLRDRNK